LEDYTNKRIDGRYEIQELIGVGGMACVYRAYDNIDDRIVAVKILKEEYLTNEEFRQRFKNESKVIAILSHPNIVKVYDVSYGDRLQYIVMEYVEGITLKEYIRQQGRLQPREVIHFSAQILRALQHAHDKGIVHRDIKPQNIMLLADGAIKVTDFGIARFSTGITKSITESAIGSVHYISPEQARGETTDDKADIYSVGVVLYEMLTGALPFQSENSVSVAMMQIQEDPKPPTQINPDIPAGLEQMTLRAMRKNPRERYQSAAEMILDLEELRRNPAVEFDYGYSVDTAPTKYITGKTAKKDLMAELDEEQESAGSRTTPVLIGVGGAVLLIVLVLVGILAFAGIGKVEVPYFQSMIYETDIKPELQGQYRNFVITTQEGTPPGITSYTLPGQVYSQSPSAKTKVKKGSAILLYIIPTDSTPNKVKIPDDLVGSSLEKAEETLKALNLRVSQYPIPGDEKDIGKVVRCDPEPGTEVDEYSTVSVYFAFLGKVSPVPNLVRDDEHAYTLEEAEFYLNQAKFILDRSDIRSADSTAPKGRVIGQSPRAGTEIPEGSSVRVILSNGKAPKSDLTIELTLPDRNGIEGEIKVYIDSELVKGSKKTLILNGSKYSYVLTGSGEKKKVLVKINDWQAYSATVDFTVVPPKVTSLVLAKPEDYPAYLYLPNVTGTSEAAGIGAIESAGFAKPSVKDRAVSDPAENGLILEQSASVKGMGDGGSYYPPNTKITIVVGRYTPPPTTTPPPTPPPTAPPTTTVNATTTEDSD